MKGDFSRFTFDRRKHYAGVRLQQGRVQLDADWNEQDDLAAYQRQTLAADLIGPSGAPALHEGFAITVAGGAIQISDGRYYVDGILCENEAPVPINGQPDPPGPVPATPTSDYPAGLYLIYLDAWQRSVTALEDPGLLELALGGADTATRLRTVWQVKMLGFPPNPGADFPPVGWRPDLRPRPLLSARAAGAPRENQLYRIEVHTPGLLGEATFKWSRDNGSVAASIENPAGNTEDFQIQITRQIGPDQAGGFATDQWIEVTDESRFLQGKPGIFAKLSSVVGQVLRVEGWPDASDPVPDLPKSPQIRRWDSDADLTTIVPATNDGYIDLDGTLEVHFHKPADASGNPMEPYFNTGDYWVVPVRAAAGVLWPTNGSGDPLPLPPHGVQHHYALLHLLDLSASGWAETDPITSYRKVFQGTTVIPGPLKLNATADEYTTSHLKITEDLAVNKKVTVGLSGTSGSSLTLVDAQLILAPGGAVDRGLQFSGTGSGSFLRYSPGLSQLTLGVDAASSLALRQGTQDRLTLTPAGRLGLQTTAPEADVHIAGSTILIRAGTSLKIDKLLTYTDGNQKAGRILTSDDTGKATWQDNPVRQLGVPKFLDLPVLVGLASGSRDWTAFTVPADKVPANASAVILEALAAMNGPDGGFASTTADIKIRKSSADAEYYLLRGRAAGGGDAIAWGSQGIFPIQPGQGGQGGSFHYQVSSPGFGENWQIRVVGYFP